MMRKIGILFVFLSVMLLLVIISVVSAENDAGVRVIALGNSVISPVAHEELRFDDSDSDVVLGTSLTSMDDDYGTDVYLEVNARDTLAYSYVFDEPIDLTKASSSHPISVTFLGTTFEITSIDSSKGFTATIDGVSQSFEDGDPYYGEDAANPDWVWNLENLDVEGEQVFEIENDFLHNDISDALTVGDCISLPNDSPAVCFEGLTVDDADYVTYAMMLSTSSDLSHTFPTLTSVDAIELMSFTSGGFELQPYTTGSGAIQEETSVVTTKQLWLYAPGATDILADGSAAGSTGTLWLAVLYKDTSDSQVKLFGYVAMNGANEIARVNYGETKDSNIVLKTTSDFDSNSLNLTLDINGTGLDDGEDDLGISWGLSSYTFDSLGDTRSIEEAKELFWGPEASPTYIGTKAENYRSRYGIIIQNPKSNGAADEVELSIPSDQVFALVSVPNVLTAKTSEKELATCEEDLTSCEEADAKTPYQCYSDAQCASIAACVSGTCKLKSAPIKKGVLSRVRKAPELSSSLVWLLALIAFVIVGGAAYWLGTKKRRTKK